MRLVAVDLDGTLLAADGSLAQSTLEAVELANQAGLAVVLASGRMHESVAPFARSLGVVGPVISYNGGLVRSSVDGEVWHRTYLPVGPVTEIVNLCRERDLHLNYYSGDRLFMSKTGRWAEFYGIHTGSPFEIRPGLGGDLPSDPTKLIIIDEDGCTRALEAELGARYAGILEVTRTNPEYLEFMAIGTTKAQALSVVAAKLGIRRRDVAALGDGRNDVEMLRWAGVGIAMCDGHPAAIAASLHQCAPNGLEGAANVIRGYAEHMLSSGDRRSIE